MQVSIVTRSVVLYLVTMFFGAFFVAPLIAPTDVPPAGIEPEPVSVWKVLAQGVVIYGVPLLLVLINIHSLRKRKGCQSL